MRSHGQHCMIEALACLAGPRPGGRDPPQLGWPRFFSGNRLDGPQKTAARTAKNPPSQTRPGFARYLATLTAKNEFSILAPCISCCLHLPDFPVQTPDLTSLYISQWPSSLPLDLSCISPPFFSHKHQPSLLFPNHMPPERTNPDIIIPSSPPLPPAPPPPPDSLESSFPIVTISIIGILATAILLLSYYAYVTKCCRNWRQFNTITRLHRSLPRHREDLLGLQPGAAGVHGLDELAIQGIPTFRYRRGQSQLSSNECPVCLNDFQEEERVRLLPNCLHVFHIDCIDAWLAMHANCPVCRSEITSTPLMPANSVTEHVVAREEGDYVRPSSENGNGGRERKLSHAFSMGDECIDIRSRGGEFGVQLMRRSFSMDSSNDRQLYIAVQEILRKNSDMQMAGGEEGSSSTGTAAGRVRRSFFSFGHYGSSKNSVLPIDREV